MMAITFHCYHLDCHSGLQWLVCGGSAQTTERSPAPQPEQELLGVCASLGS